MRKGLVFAGGGGKGAYQIGVWKAMETLALTREVDVVSGTSVGALNATLFAQGDLDRAISVWEHVDPGQILTGGSTDSLMESARALKEGRQMEGVFTLAGLQSLLTAAMRPEQIAASRIRCFATCCRLPDFSPQRFRLTGSRERMERILLASSALPAVFPPVEIDGNRYCDGGSPGGDNIPVEPVYREGCRQIIVVALRPESPVDWTWLHRFPDAEFLILCPSRSIGDFVDGTLDFNADHARARMALGEQDAMALLTRPAWKQVPEILAENFVNGAGQLLRTLNGTRNG